MVSEKNTSPQEPEPSTEELLGAFALYKKSHGSYVEVEEDAVIAQEDGAYYDQQDKKD